jgi:hypothetical protein
LAYLNKQHIIKIFLLLQLKIFNPYLSLIRRHSFEQIAVLNLESFFRNDETNQSQASQTNFSPFCEVLKQFWIGGNSLDTTHVPHTTLAFGDEPH